MGGILLNQNISMKKLFLLSILLITSIVCNAQGIYTSIIKFDKFDDIVWRKDIKTLITKTDTTFIIETKGQNPEEYYYLDNAFLAIHAGSRDSIINLVENVWGYEDQYIVFTKKDKEECFTYALEQVKDLPDSLIFDEKIYMLAGLQLIKRTDKLPTIHIRTISRYPRIFEYDTDALWIKFSDGTRIVYSKR